MPIRLDERLQRIASLTDVGRVADIGCDHGKLAYYLASTDRATHVIATDISEPSLQKARELIASNGAGELVETRLGDGLAPVADGEADTVVIAGLGGDVISGILYRAADEGKRFEKYILSPNTHAEKVRKTLNEIGQRIVYDETVRAGRKTYTVIKSESGEQSLDELSLLFGAFYLESETFEADAKRQLAYLRQLSGNAASEQLEKKIELLELALNNVKTRG